MVEAGVALHARGDGQRRRMILGAPQHGGVERPLVQIVEGGVGRRRGDNVAAERRQGVGEGEEPTVGLARGEDAQRRLIGFGDRQRIAPGREGGLSQGDFLLGDRGADQMFEPERGLGRVRRRRHRDLDRSRLPPDRLRTDGEHRQAAGGHRPAHRLDAGLGVGDAAVEDDRLERPVDQDLHRASQRARRHRPPADGVETLAQGPDQAIVRGDDQNARIGSQREISRRPSPGLSSGAGP